MQEKRYQAFLEVLDERLHRFIDTIGDVPYVALPSERPDIICFAEKIKELSGYDTNEILVDREHWVNLIYPQDQEQVFATFNKCKNEGAPFEIKYRIVHKDGSLRYIIDKGEPVFNDKGEIIKIEGVITAIGRSIKAMNIPLLEITKETKVGNVNSSVFQKV